MEVRIKNDKSGALVIRLKNPLVKKSIFEGLIF